MHGRLIQQRRLPLEALGSSVEEAIASLKPLAERRVRLGLVLAAVARENKIEVSKADLDKVIAEQIVPCGKCRFCKSGKYWMCEVHNIFGFQREVAEGLEILRDRYAKPAASGYPPAYQ